VAIDFSDKPLAIPPVINRSVASASVNVFSCFKAFGILIFGIKLTSCALEILPSRQEVSFFHEI